MKCSKNTSTTEHYNEKGLPQETRKISGVSIMAQWLTNSTGNHEVEGLNLGPAQWLNDPALL